jgi:Bacterial extracellular solute-binding protein, family 7
MDEVIDGPIGQELLDKVTDSPDTHLVGLTIMDAGARNLYDTKKPIKDIADVKGLKVRVMGNTMFVDMMERARRQRRCHGLRPGPQRIVGRHRRRRGKQPAELLFRQPLSGPPNITL